MSEFLNPEAEARHRRTQQFEELRRRRHVPHNHSEKQKILAQLHIGPVERFLLWLAKTDIYALSLATFQSRVTLNGMGMMVLFTSLMAFCTSSYTIATTMVTSGGPERVIAVLLLGSLYAFGIMIIDREIVGASAVPTTAQKIISPLVRIIFAVGIAFTVAFPVELKLFEGRIATEIQQMESEANLEYQQKIDKIKAPYLDANRSTIDGITASINSYNAEIATLTGEIDREAKNVACAARCQEFRAQKERAEQAKLQEQTRLEKVMRSVTLPPAEAAEVQKIETQMEANRGHQDLMTKWEALERLKAEPGSKFDILAMFITGFFMLLELVPLSLKATLGKTEYHYYLESRSALNHTKIVGLTNYYLDMMLRNPDGIKDMPTEITDIIARHMEDEAMAGPEYDDRSNPDNYPQSMEEMATPADARQAHAPDNGTVDERGGHR